MYAKPFSGEEKQSEEQHTMFFMEHMAFSRQRLFFATFTAPLRNIQMHSNEQLDTIISINQNRYCNI